MGTVMHVEAITGVTPELVDAFARLLPQQSPGARHPTAEQLRAIAEQPGTTLLIARDEHGVVVGTLTLIIMLTPGATFGFQKFETNVWRFVDDAPTSG